MIAALLAVAVLSAAALGYVYQITKEPIARAKDQKRVSFPYIFISYSPFVNYVSMTAYFCSL